MRVVRILIYEGGEAWINRVLAHSLRGVHEFSAGRVISACAIREVPDVKWQPWLSETYPDIDELDSGEEP